MALLAGKKYMRTGKWLAATVIPGMEMILIIFLMNSILTLRMENHSLNTLKNHMKKSEVTVLLTTFPAK